MAERTIPTHYWWQIWHEAKQCDQTFTDIGPDVCQEITSAIEAAGVAPGRGNPDAEVTISLSDPAVLEVDCKWQRWVDDDDYDRTTYENTPAKRYEAQGLDFWATVPLKQRNGR